MTPRSYSSRVHRQQIKLLVRKALEHGAKQLSPFTVEWDVSGNCQAPINREIYARKFRTERKMSYRTFDNVEDTLHGTWKPGVCTLHQDRDGPYTVFLTARCRKCENCLKKRAREWVFRAAAEISKSPRTWMGTLTLSPENHYKYQCAASLRSLRRGTPFENLSAAQQLEARHNAVQPEITKMLKRLRKKGHAFRYLLVLEAHKSGLPHYHVLLHEIGTPVRHADLTAEWTLGHNRWKLVEQGDKAAWYAAKYLSKSQSARVRASLRYGITKLPQKVTNPPKGDLCENRGLFPKKRKEGPTPEVGGVAPDIKGRSRAAVVGLDAPLLPNGSVNFSLDIEKEGL